MSTRRRHIPPILATLAVLGSCTDDPKPGSPTGPNVPEGSPRITTTVPTSEQVAADPNADWLVSFDRELDPASVDDDDIKAFGRWSGVVAGTATVDGTRRELRFTPNRALSAGEWVVVTVPAGAIRAADGTPLEPGYTWGFWAAASPGTLNQPLIAQIPARRAGEGPIQTYGAYAGDLDEDGMSDLVVPNELSNDLRIFPNDGSGGYAAFEVVPIPQGDKPSTNEGADFDGDGHIDLVVGNARGSTVSVFFGDGAGRLDHAQTLEVGQEVRGVCVLDFEGDGDADIAAVSFVAGRISFLLNDGSGSFATQSTLDVATGEWSCAATDANEDGLTDLVIGARGSGELVVLLSNGDGTFGQAQRTSAGGDPWMVAAGDLNGDGHADLVGVNAEGASISVFMGSGDGTVGTPIVHGLDGFPLALDLGDLDGDGDLDVVASDFETARFVIFENDGAGGLTRLAEELHAVQSGSCAILHDRDGDGDLDVTAIDEVVDLVLLFENR